MTDYSKHDARIDVVVSVPRPARPWSWSCIRCHEHGTRFASSTAAKRSAERHNGGAYNEGEGTR